MCMHWCLCAVECVEELLYLQLVTSAMHCIFPVLLLTEAVQPRPHPTQQQQVCQVCC